MDVFTHPVLNFTACLGFPAYVSSVPLFQRGWTCYNKLQSKQFCSFCLASLDHF